MDDGRNLVQIVFDATEEGIKFELTEQEIRALAEKL